MLSRFSFSRKRMRILIVKSRSIRLTVFFVPIMILFLVVLSACSTPISAQDSQSGTASYVGPLENSPAWIGLVVDQPQGKVLAYVCDGKAIGDWFFGALQGGTFDLTSTAGTHLRGTV